MSLYAGCAVCMIAFSCCYYYNTWNAQQFPFLTQLLFYPNGTKYDQLAILNDDFTLNQTKLTVQGLPMYAASQLLSKVSRIMYIGAAITHFGLWHGKEVYRLIKNSRTQDCDDLHYQKMKIYNEVPWWWYVSTFGICSAIGLGMAYAAKSGMPWWAFIVAIIFAAAFIPIIGTVHPSVFTFTHCILTFDVQLYCTVGYAPSIENLIHMVGGSIMPGRPVADMYFTLYGYNTVSQSLGLLRDLKLGQYTKVPPRVTFTVQMVGAAVGAVLNYVIMASVMSQHREILLDVQGSNVWSGQQIQSFNSAAIAWGALGKPLYAWGTQYGFVPYTLLFGLLAPIPTWWLHQKYPKFGYDKVFTPILVAELGYLSVGINSSVFTSFLLAIFSQWYLRKYRAAWFRKYNFLVSAALDGGTQVMIFVWSFAVGGAGGKEIPFPRWALVSLPLYVAAIFEVVADCVVAEPCRQSRLLLPHSAAHACSLLDACGRLVPVQYAIPLYAARSF
jgi:OPT family oligopeptide transporter